MWRSAELRARLAWIAVIVAIFGVEAWVVLENRAGTFSVRGRVPRAITQFGEGQPVRQAFLMQGAGLHQVQVQISSVRPADLAIEWTLWRGTPDAPATFAAAFRSTEAVALREGSQWITLSFPRDGLSSDNWYTIEIKAADATPSAPAEGVAIQATEDNPDRGGVLWLNQVRQPGSLVLRAHREGRTLYRRFEVEALPHLPGIFANAAVQWVVVLALHWAFWTVTLAVLKDGWLPAPEKR